MEADKSPIVYAVPISDYDDSKGETPIFRHPEAVKGLLPSIPGRPEIKTFQDLILETFKKHGKNPALGTREKLSDGTLGAYKFRTYDEVREICTKLGQGIDKLGLAPKLSEYKHYCLSFLGIYSKNREEYAFCDITSSMYNHVMVPVYDTLGTDAMQFVFEQTNLTTLFCSNNYIAALTKAAQEKKLGKVSAIVSWEAYQPEEKKGLTDAGITLYSLDEVLIAGETHKIELPKVVPDDVLVLSYTSGTTSKPKAVIMTHGNFISSIGGLQYSDPCYNWQPTDVHLSYLPLAHIYDRVVCSYMLLSGGSIGYFGGDVTKLRDDLLALKPTFFVSVPRLYNRFYDAMMDGISKQPPETKAVVEKAIADKIKNLLEKAEYTHEIYDEKVLKGLRSIFGGRIRMMITAAAPMSAERLNFFKVIGACPSLEVYGQTEAAGGTFSTKSNDPLSGHVGGPTASVEFKLVDVSEMKYTSKDVNEKGERCPRGELCLRGEPVLRGYYKDDENTREAIDQDGWFHTGDIGMLDATGRLRIIDRKKNILKLSQGEYIAPERIETILLRSKVVAEAFVHGESLESYCVTVMVPNPEELLNLAKRANIPEAPLEDLCKNEEVKKLVLAELDRVGKLEGLQGFEIPRKVHLRPDSFGKDGLMTATMKLKRYEVRVFHNDIFHKLYKEGEVPK